MSFSFLISNASLLNWHEISQKLEIQTLNDVQNNGLWPSTALFIYKHNISARALHTEYDGNDLNIRILSGSAPADYCLALKLIKHVSEITHSTITPEDSHALLLNDFLKHYDINWAKAHCTTALNQMFKQILNAPEHTVEFSTVFKPVTLSAKYIKSLIKFKQLAAKVFFERITFYNYHVETDAQLTNYIMQDHTEHYSRVCELEKDKPCFIFDENTGVSFEHDNQTTYIRASDLDELLPQAQFLSHDILYVESINQAQWAQLFESAQAKAKDIAYFRCNFIHAENDELDDTSFYKLCDLPLIIFLIVAGADGEIDSDEIDVFRGMLVLNTMMGSDFLNKMMTHLLEVFESRTEQLIQQPDTHLALLQECIQIMRTQLNNDQTKEIKKTLMMFAHMVSNASEDAFGNAISDEEANAIHMLKTVLEAF